MGLDSATLITGMLVFFARIIDVSLGTIRTLYIVRGRMGIAFFLGLLEISMWLVVISAVIKQIADKPVLGVFYALGFSTGNVVGIILERRIASGNLVLRVFVKGMGRRMAERIRQKGYPVTTFRGQGATGPVTSLYIVCRRRDLKKILPVVHELSPDAFYTTEQVGIVSKIHYPHGHTHTGWRTIFKKK